VPRFLDAAGGKTTAAKHLEAPFMWGKKGGRGKRKRKEM
jgi:hypothetical protein